METTQLKTLNTWLRNQIFGSRTCERIDIHHIAGTGKLGNQISSIQMGEDISPEDIDGLITRIETDCLCDAEALGNFQRYALMAYFESEKQASRRLVIKFTVNDTDGDSLDSEPANKEGLTRQLMRHTEATMKIATGSVGNVIAMQNRIITNLEEQNTKLQRRLEKAQERSFELVEVLENLQSQKHTRELESYQAETKARMVREIGSKAMLLLPAVVNRITGKKALKEGITPEGMMLREFVKSFSPEQMEAINANLKPEQQVVFNGVVEHLLKQEISEMETSQKSEEDATKENSDG